MRRNGELAGGEPGGQKHEKDGTGGVRQGWVENSVIPSSSVSPVLNVLTGFCLVFFFYFVF